MPKAANVYPKILLFYLYISINRDIRWNVQPFKTAFFCIGYVFASRYLVLY